MRRLLPDRRASWTQKLVVGGRHIYVTFGEYDDGTLGEVFLTVDRWGTAMRSLLDAFAVSFSLGIQHGVPLATAVNALRGIDFLPSGKVEGAEDFGVREAPSMLAAVAAVIEAAYLKE